MLALAPLAAAAVERIARLHLPATADVPVHELLAETGGVPLVVHRAATAWARARVTERLAATIEQASAGRGELRAAETSLAGGFVDLQHVRERGERYLAAPSVPAVCPYVGLAAYDAEHAAYFSGRERLLGELVARLAGASLLAIVGPSGSGKSSACARGCCRRWPSGALRGPTAGARRCCARASGPRRCSSGRCGRRPGQAARGRVDQFEEAFTACRDEAERMAFFDALVAAAQAGTLVLLGAARRLLRSLRGAPGAGGAAAASQVLVGAMRPRRVAAGDRAPGGARGADGRARAHRRARRRRGGRARWAAAALDDARRAVARARRAHAAHGRLRAQRRRARGRRPAGRADLRAA